MFKTAEEVQYIYKIALSDATKARAARMAEERAAKLKGDSAREQSRWAAGRGNLGHAADLEAASQPRATQAARFKGHAPADFDMESRAGAGLTRGLEGRRAPPGRPPVQLPARRMPQGLPHTPGKLSGKHKAGIAAGAVGLAAAGAYGLHKYQQHQDKKLQDLYYQ